MPIDVFLSLHVGSTRASGVYIAHELRKIGLTVWICTESLAGGDSYRDEIVKAIKECKVFLPLINAEWAKCKHVLLKSRFLALILAIFQLGNVRMSTVSENG